MSVFGLKLTNEGLSSKKEDLIETFSKKIIILLDDEFRVMSINISQ